jgi:hypothetical protein
MAPSTLDFGDRGFRRTGRAEDCCQVVIAVVDSVLGSVVQSTRTLMVVPLSLRSCRLLCCDDLVDAYRTGAGVPYARYGPDLHEGQAGFTRPMFDQLLGTQWLPDVPEIDARLRPDPPARVADVACGEGRSSIAIARAYPKVHVDGIDSDEASIAAARQHLESSGVEDRVAFHVGDAAGARPER